MLALCLCTFHPACLCEALAEAVLPVSHIKASHIFRPGPTTVAYNVNFRVQVSVALPSSE